MDVPVKFGDSSSNGSEIYSSEAVECSIFDRFLNFDNCQVVSDVISGMADQDASMNVSANFGDSR